MPAIGYAIDSGKGQLVFTGDTTYSREVLDALNQLPDLRHLIIEAAFPDALQGLALASRHMCPSLLAMMLGELNCRPEVYVTHLKPGKGKRIMAEIGAYRLQMPVHRLRQGMVLEF